MVIELSLLLTVGFLTGFEYRQETEIFQWEQLNIFLEIDFYMNKTTQDRI